MIEQQDATYKRLKQEAITGARFGLVGLISTTIHIAIVWLALTRTNITVLSANTIAFLIAFGMSYLGNYLWTFRSPGKPYRALLRLFMIAAFSLAVNSTILELFISKNWFEPFTAATISATAIPLITFLCSRLWAFERSERTPP